MNVSKKALSLLLSITLVAGTFTATGAFAATGDGTGSGTSSSATSTSDLTATKEGLENEIGTASQYVDSINYTTASWSAFQTAFDNAKECLNNPEAQTADFQTATTNLRNAIEGLSDAAAAKENLTKEIKTASQYTDKTKYTDASWSAFQTALTNAQECLNNPEAQTADFQTATTNLHNAIEGLAITQAAAKEDLTNEIATASSLKEADYTGTSWSAFQTALTNAQECLNDSEAQTADFQTATTNLKNAIKGLIPTNLAGMQKALDFLDSENASAAEVASLATAFSTLTETDKQELLKTQGNKFETVIEETLLNGKTPTQSFTTKGDPIRGVSADALALAAGVTKAGSTVSFNLTQNTPASGEAVNFNLGLTRDGKSVEPIIPVTVTVKLPTDFFATYPNGSYTYAVQHNGSTIPSKFDAASGTVAFTTDSFSPFTVVATLNSPNNPNNPSTPGTPVTPTNPTIPVTFVSDTTVNFDVNGAYTFKITSKDGKVPTFVVGTANVFDTQLVNQDGNDYYFKITAVGAPGAKAGIYVNGTTRLLVATVKSNPSYVKSDTTSPFSVKAGKSYVFKLTADAKPTFVAGTGAAFRVDFVGQSGKDYFFRVTAVGKAGHSSGFYINRLKTPVAKATIA